MQLFIKEEHIYCKCEICDGDGTIEETFGGWDSPDIRDVTCENCDGSGVIYYENCSSIDPCEVFEAYDDNGKFIGFSFWSILGEMLTFDNLDEANTNQKTQ